MSDSTERALEQAFERVEAGFPEEAVNILKPILDADPDDVDAWWIYAHAVADPNEARRALSNVQRLDPEYPGATDLMTQLDEKFPAPRIRRLDIAPPPSVPEVPPDIPEPPAPTPARTSTPSPAATPSPATTQRRSSFPIIPVVIAVVLIAVVLLLLLRPSGDQTDVPATPTSVAVVDATPTPELIGSSDVTDEPIVIGGADSTPEVTDSVIPTEPSGSDATAEPTSEATVEVTQPPDATAEPTASAPEATAESTAEGGVSGDFSALNGVLSRYTLPENGVETIDTALGRTLVVNVCAAPGPEMRTRAPEVLTLISRESPSFPTNLDAIGARMVNCETGATMLTLVVDRETADAFAQRTIPAREFQGRWQSI